MRLTSLDANSAAAARRRACDGCGSRSRVVLRAVLASLLVALPASASETLELTPDLVVTGVLFVAFLVLILPLNHLIFRPLLRVMDEREERIAGARRRAERVQVQAQESLQRYEDAIREAYQEASAERRQKLDVARAELQSVTQQARQDAEQELVRARQELQGSLSQARDSLRASASELADLAAERILGRSLS
jgi:F-type H+-transporting ATPase subunit b